MDTKLLEQMIRDAISNQMAFDWKFYSVMLFVIFLGNCLFSFVKSYFSKKGEGLATKEDLELIINQQKEITKTTESIKNEINHIAWLEKEYKILRRTKLEELLILVYDEEDWLDKKKNYCLFYEEECKGIEPINKISMLNNLYFPELSVEVVNFKDICSQYNIWCILGKKEILDKMSASNLKPRCSQAHLDQYPEIHKKFLASLSEIEKKSSEIMKEIIIT